MKEYYTGKNQAGLSTLYKNELIKGEDSFMRRHVKQNDKFVLICGGFEPIQFKRFGRVEFGDYFYMSDTYYDAVAYRPVKDVFFLGFGFMN